MVPPQLRPPSTNRNSITIPRPGPAKNCDICERQPGELYCVDCKTNFCDSCWKSQPIHKSKKGRRPHHQMPFAQYQHLYSILNPDLSSEQRDRLHVDQRQTLWLAVDTRKSSKPTCRYEERFRDLLAEHEVKEGTPSEIFPRLVSFIGNTGSGKSTLIRTLLEQPWLTTNRSPRAFQRDGPVVGRKHDTVPTSGDVHLYMPSAISATFHTSPILYADCEGLQGGDVAPPGAFYGQEERAEARRSTKSRDNDNEDLDPLTTATKDSTKMDPSTEDLRKKDAKTQESTTKESKTKTTSKSRRSPPDHNFALKERFSPTLAQVIQFTRSDKLGVSRNDAVQSLFPPMLYNFSDVVVFVVAGSDARTLEQNIVRFLDWTKTSSTSAINRSSLPHLVVALNKAFRDAEMDAARATEKIFQDHAAAFDANTDIQMHKARFQKAGFSINNLEDLLRMCYASVQFLWIPNEESDPHLLPSQVKQLSDMVEEKSKESQGWKSKRGMCLNSAQQDLFFRYGFQHFTGNDEGPFDFVKTLLSSQPMPSSLQDKFFEFLRPFCGTKSSKGSLCNHAFPTLASAIALDATRFLPHIPGTLVNIFQGGLHDQSEHPIDEKTITYKGPTRKAMKNLCDQFSCEFEKDGDRCVLKRVAHQDASSVKTEKGHRNLQGVFFAPGNFKSSYVEWIEENWEENIRTALSNIDNNIANDQSSKSRQEKIWDVHERNLKRLCRSSGPKIWLNSFICSWCIRGVPEQFLSCDHGICVQCAKFAQPAGERSSGQHLFRILTCPLHRQRKTLKPKAIIQAKPTLAGIRILALDGGGVRGILELIILRAVEERLGGEIRVQRFFDLVCGTSAGGIIALGLCANDWTTESCQEVYRKICHKTFRTTLPSLNFISTLFTGHSYQTKPLEQVLQDQFGKKEKMLTAGHNKVYDEDTKHINKIVITATKNHGKTACIFTNYARDEENSLSLSGTISHSKTYDYEMGARGITFKLWQVARATSAAPTYFKPFKEAKLHPFEYLDGGLLNNNPAPIAEMEAANLWPSTRNTNPDLLLSVGSGFSDQPRNKPTGPRKQPGRPNIKLPFNRWAQNFVTLRHTLEKNMDSECIWKKHFHSKDTSRYIRLNNCFEGNVAPGLDDVGKLGILEEAGHKFVKKHQKEINFVAQRLVATSFYYQPNKIVPVDEHGNTTLDGYIGCRFHEGSSDLEKFLKFLKDDNLCFTLKGTSQKWNVDRHELINFQVRKSFQVPEVSFSLKETATDFTIVLKSGFVDIETPISGCPCPIRAEQGGRLVTELDAMVL